MDGRPHRFVGSIKKDSIPTIRISHADNRECFRLLSPRSCGMNVTTAQAWSTAHKEGYGIFPRFSHHGTAAPAAARFQFSSLRNGKPGAARKALKAKRSGSRSHALQEANCFGYSRFGSRSPLGDQRSPLEREVPQKRRRPHAHSALRTGQDRGKLVLASGERTGWRDGSLKAVRWTRTSADRFGP
jgi:hypothetical protein